MSKLSLIVSKKNYREFKGADWPSYEDFINHKYSVTDAIQTEIIEFVEAMEENYNNIATARTDELSLANQKRQSHVFYDKKFQGTHCEIPWNTLGINSNGNVFICASPSWIPIFIGNVLEVDNIYDILNSDIALKIRQEILKGRYYYCNQKLCDFFSFKKTSDFQSHATTDTDLQPLEFEDSPELHVSSIPANIIFDFDLTCNFKCPSCRSETINSNADHIIRPINDRIVDKIKRLVIDKIEKQFVNIRWAGGEPFMSDVYLELLDYIVSTGKRNITNIIHTNGSLLKSKAELVKNLLPYTSDLRISFDAGCEQTYKLTRVGGQWNNLIENVKFVKDLIERNNYKTRLYGDFVVQKNNYKDLPLFADFCRENGLLMNIQKMWNWDTWNKDVFDDMNIYNSDHYLYNDLKKHFQLANLPMAEN